MKIILVLLLLESVYLNYSLIQEGQALNNIVYQQLAENDNLQYQINQCRVLHVGQVPQCDMESIGCNSTGNYQIRFSNEYGIQGN